MVENAENVAGNYYNKYETMNPIARYLVNGFFETFDYFLNTSKPLKIMEIGCGEGVLAKRMAHMGHEVYATDVDDNIISLAQQNFGSSERLIFEAKSIYDLAEGSLKDFDLIVCCEVFEHLPEPQTALEILYKSGAKNVVMSVPREPIWRILNMARFKYISDLGNTPGHLNHWSNRAFLSFVGQYFKVKEMRKPLPWTFVYLDRAENEQQENIAA